jgi:hypothetical protein
MKSWIITTLIAGFIFFMLAQKVHVKAQKIINKDYEIVSYYTKLLDKQFNYEK